jgi:hypothetical protein
MIYQKTNPVGLDAVIAEIQVKLMALATTWGAPLDGYPRCYPQLRDGRKVIEYSQSLKEYKELIYAEGNKFFFICENDLVQVGNGYFTTDLSVYFMLDLTDAMPSVTHRADAEVWADVVAVLQTIPIIGKAERIVQGFDRVFAGYDYQPTDDLQPYHYFRIDVPVMAFQLTKTYCS